MASTINLLRLLADPTRLRLLLLLEQEELSVAELQQILGMGQSRISSQLAQLKRAGVVADRRVGKNVYYGANHHRQNAQRERVAEITRLLARELSEGSRDRTSMKLVLQKRQDKARKYFDELAGKFGRGYVPGRSWQALAHTLITLLPPLTVADLGDTTSVHTRREAAGQPTGTWRPSSKKACAPEPRQGDPLHPRRPFRWRIVNGLA